MDGILMSGQNLMRFLMQSHIWLSLKVVLPRICMCECINIYIYLNTQDGEGNGTPLQYSCLKNPRMEEPGRLQSMGSLRVGHNWATSLSLFTFIHWRRKWQPTPLFLPGESQGGGSLVGCVYGVAQSRTQLKRLSSINLLWNRSCHLNVEDGLVPPQHTGLVLIPGS